MPQVVWFKRDLRVWDHRPLFEAAQRGPVIPLYVIEPEVIHAPDFSKRHWSWICGALRDLSVSLAALGQPLIVRQGDVVEVLQELLGACAIDHLWAHEETGNGITYARDRAVRRWARTSGVPFTEYPQNGVVRRLEKRDGWARNWEERMAQALTSPPSHLVPVPHIASDLVPGQAEIRANRQTAVDTLDSFLAGRGVHYSRELSSPLTAETSCSRLSAHLAYGLISVREVVQTTRTRIGIHKQQSSEEAKAWLRSLRAFDARLHWHCHFMQKLEDEPRIEFENFVRAFDGMRDNEPNGELFSAWKEGRTGYPFMDACMRYLRATGWINFRMRAMLVSFSSYHLWQHWRAPSIFLARLFEDYEPGIHYSQFQMQSGTTGINTLRIYSPLKQGLDQDPDARFVRQWVPELAGEPLTRIHKPDPALLIVDPKIAVSQARARLALFRRKPEATEQRKEVMRKHGSRKQGRPKKTTKQMILFS